MTPNRPHNSGRSPLRSPAPVYRDRVITLPPDFVRTTVAREGDTGAAWLAGLPHDRGGTPGALGVRAGG